LLLFGTDGKRIVANFQAPVVPGCVRRVGDGWSVVVRGGVIVVKAVAWGWACVCGGGGGVSRINGKPAHFHRVPTRFLDPMSQELLGQNLELNVVTELCESCFALGFKSGLVGQIELKLFAFEFLKVWLSVVVCNHSNNSLAKLLDLRLSERKEDMIV
jgi:hypothetical protein